MIYRTIDVCVPFEGCKHCKKFDVSKSTMYSNNEEYITYYACDKYQECENAHKVASMVKVAEAVYTEYSATRMPCKYYKYEPTSGFYMCVKGHTEGIFSKCDKCEEYEV